MKSACPRRRPLQALHLALATLAWAVPALVFAGPAAPEPSACPISIATESADDLPASQARSLAELEAMEPQCLKNAAYYRQRGQTQLAAGLWAPALESLERALLLQPEHPGTQLDYAQALQAMGMNASALALLQQLAQRPDTPAHLQPWLSQRIDALGLAIAQQDHEAAETATSQARSAGLMAWEHRGQVGIAAGYSNNLNNAPVASQLTLTFPDLTVNLPLDATSRARSGLAMLGHAQWVGLHSDGPQLWVVEAGARQRAAGQSNDQYTQLNAAATWLQAPAEPRQWQAKIDALAVYWGGKSLIQQLRGATMFQWDTLPLPTLPYGCRPSLGAATEWRGYPATPVLDGQYLGLQGGFFCLPAGDADGPTLNWQIRTGHDHATQATRPGGLQRSTEMHTTLQQRLGNGLWVLEHTWLQQQDQSGYSALLANNAPRHTGRHSLRLEWSAPLPDWTPLTQLGPKAHHYLAWEGASQTSNLQPFASRQQSLWWGLRWPLGQ